MENPLHWTRAVLASTPARWTQLAEALPAELLARPPAPGEWAALECLQHLIDTEQVFQFRVRAFLAGQDFPLSTRMPRGRNPVTRLPPGRQRSSTACGRPV